MYGVRTQYAPAGAINLFQMKSPLTQSRVGTLIDPSKIGFAQSESMFSTSNLIMVGAVAGAGLLAYVAARALKK